jgi:hypothetical protein
MRVNHLDTNTQHSLQTPFVHLSGVRHTRQTKSFMSALAVVHRSSKMQAGVKK